MDDHEDFLKQRRATAAAMAGDARVAALSRDWLHATAKYRYSYHFDWCGLPIIQYPQDIVAMQELIWTVRPQIIVETGIARGGSLIFYAGMLTLLEACGMASDTRVIGIDIDIRAHNRRRIEAHPLARRIELIEGSSLAEDTLRAVRARLDGKAPVLVCLDSNHTHAHVEAELRHYAPLVSVASYIVVFDTIIEFMPQDAYPDRPWSRGDNAYTAVRDFMAAVRQGEIRGTDGAAMAFEIDGALDDKLLISVAPSGYLKRVR